MDRGMDKDVVHIYNGILLSHKKEQNSAICRDVDGPRDCHTEWNKSDRERLIPYDITYMWKQTYVENKLMVMRDKLGDWDWHIHTTIYTMYKIGN